VIAKLHQWWCEPSQKRFPVIWQGLTQTGRKEKTTMAELKTPEFYLEAIKQNVDAFQNARKS